MNGWLSKGSMWNRGFEREPRSARHGPGTHGAQLPLPGHRSYRPHAFTCWSEWQTKGRDALPMNCCGLPALQAAALPPRLEHLLRNYLTP